MNPERLTVDVSDAAILLGISRSTAFNLVRRRVIPSIRLGRRLLISKRVIERLLSSDDSQTTGDSDNRS